MDQTTNIITFENLPPQISFFCPFCVTNNGVTTGVHGEPVNCDHCDNLRLIAHYETIETLTPDYCKPFSNFTQHDIKEGVYYVMLVQSIEGFMSELTDLHEYISTVRSARFMKDRFFFITPLPIDIVLDVNFFTDITWIPKT